MESLGMRLLRTKVGQIVTGDQSRGACTQSKKKQINIHVHVQ